MFYKCVKILFLLAAILMLIGHHCAAEDRVILSRVDFVDASCLDVVLALAKAGGLDIILGSDVSSQSGSKVTLHMRDVPCLDAIDSVLRVSGFKFQMTGKTVLISALARDISGPAYFKNVPQVLIESRVVEVSESGIEELGIKWGRETGAFKFSYDGEKIRLAEDILITLKTLVGEGKAEILAQPSIVSLDGKEAQINIGSRIPYAVPVSTSSGVLQWTVQYIDAGVSLKIIPKVLGEGFISVSLRPEVSSISEWRVTSAGEFPVITTRNAQSEVRVKNGETIVIGGLINRSDRENISKIALLSDIPVLGALFCSRVKESAKTEVVFLITPRIL